MGKPLENEFKYYIEHQDELVKKYNGRVIVIKEGKVLGSYNSDMEAITETTKTHELGTFLVKKCEPGEESYTEVFHSRIAFV